MLINYSILYCRQSYGRKKKKRAKILGQRPKGRNKKECERIQISKEWIQRAKLRGHFTVAG